MKGLRDGEVHVTVEAVIRRKGTAWWVPWSVVCALPGVLWLVLAMIAAARGFAYEPTGDALLDRYITTMSRGFARNLIQAEGVSLDLVLRYECMAKQECAGWAGEFAEDPRYWTLAALIEDRETGCQQQDGDRFRAAYLQTHERGTLSGALALMHLQAYNGWYIEQLVSRQIDSRAWDGATIEGRREIRSARDAGDGAPEFEEILQSLLDVAGDDALPWYIKATIEVERLNYDQAVRCLEQGNAAPGNHSLRGFPEEELPVLCSPDSPVNRSYAWLVTILDSRESVLDTVGFEETFGDLARVTAENGDRYSLGVLHESICRLCLQDRGTPWEGFRYCAMLREVSAALQNANPGQLSAEETLALNQLADLVNRLEQVYPSSIGNLKFSYQGSLIGRTVAQLALHGLDHLTTFGAAGLVEDCESTIKYNLDREDVFTEDLTPLIEEIRRFDYATLSFSAE